MNDPHLRMSDAEREQAASELAEHYVQGRLTTEEHSERLDQIWAARTRAELAPVFRDLPGRFGPPPFAQPFNQPFRPPFAQPFRPPVNQPFRPPYPPAFNGYAAPARRTRKRMPAPLMALLVILLIITVLTNLPIIIVGLLAWGFFATHRHRPAGRRHW
jgi:hypothetical protein